MTTIEKAQSTCLRANDLISQCTSEADKDALKRAVSYLYNAIQINYFVMIVEGTQDLKAIIKYVEEVKNA